MYQGKITKANKKRKYYMGREAINTTSGEDKKKKVRVRGGDFKPKLVSSGFVNVVIDDKGVKCGLLSLVKNPANKDFTRRNIITKGAVLKVETPKGDEIQVKVTSRPGQDGVLNAVPLL